MRRLFIAITLALSLGGCATVQTLLDASRLATASIANPVTQDRLNTLEQTLTIAFAGLNAYKQACIKGAADMNCRTNIKAIQAYTRRVPPLLVQLRGFVKANDQINAVVVYNQVKTLIDNFKSAAAAAGVNVGG